MKEMASDQQKLHSTEKALGSMMRSVIPFVEKVGSGVVE